VGRYFLKYSCDIYHSQEQDKHLEELTVGVGKIGEYGKEMGEQLKGHNKMIEKLQLVSNINEMKIQKTQSKLMDYLNRTSNCFLYIVIAIELAIFVILVAF